MLKLLSRIMYGCRRINPGEWLIGVAALWWGWVKLETAPAEAHALWAVAAVLVLAAQVSRAMNYAIFVPDPRRDGAPLPEKPLPALVYGAAVGNAMWMPNPLLPLPAPYRQFGQSVQIRWLNSLHRPPVLAVLTPHTLDPALRFPEEEARVWSLWYPGTRIRHGWLYLNGREYPALEFTFVGRRLWLAVKTEEIALLLAGTLQAAEASGPG